ncbi:MAG: glycoside hydrolase family 9 protein [Desulfobacterales bacterium]|jgi:hypothetical protein
MKRLILIVCFILFTAIFTSYGHSADQKNFIRVNQLGFLEKDVKRAIISSNNRLAGNKFSIKNLQRNEVVFDGKIGSVIAGVERQSSFAYNYVVEFTALETVGSYRIELEDKITSPTFAINNNVYAEVIDGLLYFLRVARCGNTKAELHKPCHLFDATNTDLDLTGGWHDAGDYLKFTRSIAYVTYTLLLSYEVSQPDLSKHFSDLNHNGIADVLDEAKIGLDYLVKVFPDPETFVYIVGDRADHHQGVRMPEDDKLAKTKRPAWFGFRRNVLSQYAFAMALGSAIFKEIPQHSDKAKQYLSLAKRAYIKAQSVEKKHFDKLCLAATELYRATQEPKYLSEAKAFSDKLSVGHWGNWADNTILAHARLGEFYAKATKKLRDSVAIFYNLSNKHLFGYNTAYTFSGLYAAITTGSAGWFYKSLSNDDSFDDLATRIRDYLLGTNPWGVCFISGFGTNYPKNIHNRLARSLKKTGVLQNGTIKGAIPGGPVKPSEWEKRWSDLVPEGEDINVELHPPGAVYYDHFRAYPTNEASIYGPSEAILFFSFYLRYLSDIPD